MIKSLKPFFTAIQKFTTVEIIFTELGSSLLYFYILYILLYFFQRRQTLECLAAMRMGFDPDQFPHSKHLNSEVPGHAECIRDTRSFALLLMWAPLKGQGVVSAV